MTNVNISHFSLQASDCSPHQAVCNRQVSISNNIKMKRRASQEKTCADCRQRLANHDLSDNSVKNLVTEDNN